MLPGACVMWGLWHVARLFAGFRQLQFFSSGNVRHFRLFAVAVLLTGFVRPAASALMSLVTTLDNPAAHRFVALTAGDSELTAIFLGLFLVTIAWVMEQGQRLAEENEQFV